MKFIDNFSETHLLFGYDIEIILLPDNNNLNSNEVLYTTMTLPKFKHCYFDYKFQNFLGLIINSYEDTLKHTIKLKDVTSLYSLFHGILITSKFNSFYAQIIEYAMGLLISNFNINNGYMCIYDKIITEDLFNRIVDIIKVSTEHKKIHELAIKDAQVQALEEKIAKIKKQNQKNINGNANFLESYMILTYEFNYTATEIINMTMYAITNILKYTGKSINYKVSLIGAGNGLSKKIHFITEKGNK